MRLNLPNSEHVSVEVVAPGTAGIAFDSRIRVTMSCGPIEGEVEAWCDGPDVEGFANDLLALGRDLSGTATLASDDGRSLHFSVRAIDAVGHFVVEVELNHPRVFGRHILEAGCKGTFVLESSALSRFCFDLAQELVSGVRP